MLIVAIIWQLLQSLNNHQLSTNADKARKAGRPIPVGIVTAQTGKLDSLLAAECIAKESARVELSTETGGQVIRINVSLGAAVKKGQVLLKFDDTLQKAYLDNTKQAELVLQTLRDELEPFISDMRKLREKTVVSTVDLLDAIERQRRAELDIIRVGKEKIDALTEIKKTEVKSPLSGVLTGLSVEYGSVLRPFQDVATISRLDPLLLDCEFGVDALPKIEDFDKASVVFSSYPGKSYSVEMEKILPVVDEDSHAVVAQFNLANKDQTFLPGMRAVVRLEKLIEGVKVPATSLIGPDGDSAHVFVVTEDQRANLVAVTTGRYAGGFVEIKSGISSGQRVVIAGQGSLQNGDLVTEQSAQNRNEVGDEVLFPEAGSDN